MFLQNKKAKTILVVLSILLLIASIVTSHVLKTNFKYVNGKALEYLCEKYDAKPSEFELVDHNQAHYWREPFDIKREWIDFAFEYKYKGRNFLVVKEKGKFYDDYQYEDLEKWCTDWLKENVDEDIIGIDLFIDDLVKYHSSTKDYSKIEKSDIKSFLECGNVFGIYYYNPTLSKSLLEAKNYNDVSKYDLKLEDRMKNIMNSECSYIFFFNNKPNAQPERNIIKHKLTDWSSSITIKSEGIL